MEEEISILAKQHSTWVSYAISFGCNETTAHDLVQEMYIKVDDYLKRHGSSIFYNDDEINFYFVYVTIRNLFLDLKRKGKNVDLVELGDLDFFAEESDYQQEDSFEKYRVIEEYLMNEDYIDLTQENILLTYDSEKYNNFYKRAIFEEVYILGKSIRQLSKETGIKYYSLYNTIQNIKKELQDEYKTRERDSFRDEVDRSEMVNRKNRNRLARL